MREVGVGRRGRYCGEEVVGVARVRATRVTLQRAAQSALVARLARAWPACLRARHEESGMGGEEGAEPRGERCDTVGLALDARQDGVEEGHHRRHRKTRHRR
eukprot:4879274-Pleurochrysis_carterae.AAC.1